MFLKIVIIILVVFILGFYFEKFLRKRFSIEKEAGFLYKYVNSVHKWGEWIILLLFAVGLFYLSYLDLVGVRSLQLFVAYFVVSLCFRAFMEWKYAAPSKKYLLTVMSLVFILIMVLLLYSFNLLNLS